MSQARLIMYKEPKDSIFFFLVFFLSVFLITVFQSFIHDIVHPFIPRLSSHVECQFLCQDDNKGIQ